MPRSFKSGPSLLPVVFQPEPGRFSADEADDLAGFKSSWLVFEPVSAAIFSSRARGSDLHWEKKNKNNKKMKNETDAKHFIFTMDAFFRQGKQQISAPTGVCEEHLSCSAVSVTQQSHKSVKSDM